MNGPGVTRRLWAVERDKVRDHLLRLEPEARRLRFGGYLSDAGVEAYCEALNWSRAVIVGHVVDGEVRGLGELKPLRTRWPRAAEVAFSVESPFRNCGIGTELLRRLAVIARNRSITILAMICLAGNDKVVRIARKLGARVEVRHGEADARLALPWPSHLTLLLELLDDLCAIHGPARLRVAGPGGSQPDLRPAGAVSMA